MYQRCTFPGMGRSTETLTIRVKREVSAAIAREAAKRSISRNEMLSALFAEMYAKGADETPATQE